MSKIELFTYSSGDRGDKVRAVLNLLSLPFADSIIQHQSEGNPSAEYLKLNPVGTFPVLAVDGQLLTESDAICEYLAERFSPGVLSVSPQEPARAEYLKWMHFAGATLEPALELFYDLGSRPAEARESFSKKCDRLRDAIERQLLKSTGPEPFIVANRLTAADICLCYGLRWKGAAGIRDKSPVIAEYVKRMSSILEGKEHS